MPSRPTTPGKQWSQDCLMFICGGIPYKNPEFCDAEQCDLFEEEHECYYAVDPDDLVALEAFAWNWWEQFKSEIMKDRE